MKEDCNTDRNDEIPTLTRRKFLHGSYAAGVGLGITSQSLLSQQGNDGKKKELRVAIIGCGSWAEALRSASSNIEGVRFAAVCDERN